MQDRINKILRRYETAQPEKTRFKTLYDPVYYYGMPDKYGNVKDAEGSSESTGNDNRAGIFSSVFENSCDGFVQFIQNMLCPVNFPWIDLEAGYMFGDDGQDNPGRDEANRRLGTLARLLNIYKDTSNFDISFTEALYDLVPGTACLLVIEGTKENPILFIPVPFRDITMIKDAHGEICAYFRPFNYKSSEIKEVWADADWMVEPDKEYEDIEIIECCEFNKKRREWDYLAIAKKNKKVIVERHYQQSPFVDLRWATSSGETYGRGQGLKAIKDFMVLNRLKEYALRSLAFLVPFFLVKQGENYRNWVIRPGALLPVSSNVRDDPAMQQMGISQQADLQQFNMENLEMSVNKTMFVMSVPNSREVSATEYTDRKSDLTKILNNSVGRLVSFQYRLVKRMVEVLQRQGKFPPEFDSQMLNGFGARIKINTILGSLRDAEEVQKKLTAIGMLNNFDPTGNTTARFIKADTAIPKILSQIGMDWDEIRDAEELAQYDKMLAQAAEAQHNRAVNEDVAIHNAKAKGTEQARKNNGTN
jgi:hypothetical protein